MAGIYNIPLQGAYNLPGYAQPQYDQYYQQYPPQYQPSQQEHDQDDDLCRDDTTLITHQIAIIKEEVNNQLPQILPTAISDFATPMIEKNVTESLEVAVLAKSSSQPHSSYATTASLSEFKLRKILMDKMEKNKLYLRADYKRELYDALVNSYNIDKDLFDTYGEAFMLKQGQADKDKDQDPPLDQTEGRKERSQARKEIIMEYLVNFSKRRAFWSLNEDILKVNNSDYQYAVSIKEYTAYPCLHSPKTTKETRSIRQLMCLGLRKKSHLDAFMRILYADALYGCFIHQTYCHSMASERSSTWCQKLPKEAKPHHARHIQARSLESNSIHSYSDPQGIIYKYQNQRNRLMRTDDLHKFSDGTLDDVRSALHDITMGIRMEYLPKKHWRNLDKRRAQVMIQNNDKHLFQRRLMRNLEKFVGGREYGEVLRLDKVLKLKNFKKDALLKFFKLTNQERYEHVGPKVTSSQDGKDYKMAKRDYAWLMISKSSRSHLCQVKDTSQSLKSKITTSCLQDEVKKTIPSYCVSLLSVNKLIRDSKMFVGFDEEKCYIQDLTKKKTLGTCSESGGLYLFDMPAKCSLGKSNFVMDFNVSKLLWHNRLGHPTDKVLSTLHNDLKIFKSSFLPVCEVCYRAKQTREPFPLSDHKSKDLGELVHLD
ncbi:ribonuclease H-like domain-containing protein [Tanacetum coccineum]